MDISTRGCVQRAAQYADDASLRLSGVGEDLTLRARERQSLISLQGRLADIAAQLHKIADRSIERDG